MQTLNEKSFESFIQTLSLTNQDVDTNYLSKVAAMLKRYENNGFKERSLDVLMEILTLSPQGYDLRYIAKVVALIKYYEDSNIGERWIEVVREILTLTKKEYNWDYLSRIIDVVNSEKDMSRLEDSLSVNQFKSKMSLLKAIESLDILDSDSTVVIWGCWYGSILIPYLQNKVKQVTGIDLDDDVISFSKSSLFHDFTGVDLITDDIFNTHRNIYKVTDLVINTSCEHMAPMKDWPWFKHGALATDRDYTDEEIAKDPQRIKQFSEPQFSHHCYFAFQSNNMEGIEGHINCVQSLDEFKSQLPSRAQVFIEDQIEDERGTRFMLLGKFN